MRDLQHEISFINMNFSPNLNLLIQIFTPIFSLPQVYYKIFCAARKIVLEERRAQSHLEAHCNVEIEPATHHTSATGRPLNFDAQPTQSSPTIKQHRSSSASTTVSTHSNSSLLFFSLICPLLHSNIYLLLFLFFPIVFSIRQKTLSVFI